MKVEEGSGLRSLRIAVVIFVLGALGVWTRTKQAEREAADSVTTKKAAPSRCPRGTLEERGLCVPVRVPEPVDETR